MILDLRLGSQNPQPTETDVHMAAYNCQQWQAHQRTRLLARCAPSHHGRPPHHVRLLLQKAKFTREASGGASKNLTHIPDVCNCRKCKNIHAAKGALIYITTFSAFCAVAPLETALSRHTRSQSPFIKVGRCFIPTDFNVAHKKQSFSQTAISFLHGGIYKGGQRRGDCSQQGKK